MGTKCKVTCLVIGVLLLLGGCTPGEGSADSSALDPQNPVTITLWHYYVGDNKIALETAIDAFNQTVGIEKGVIVEPVAKGSIMELEDAITSSAKGVINADPMPDIFSSYPDKALEIDQLGKLCDMNAYFSEEERALYVDSFLQDGIFEEGRLLIIPIVKSTELLYVNATAWNDFAASNGYDEEVLSTWEGIYDVARAYFMWTDAKTPDIPWDGQSFMGFDAVANFVIIGNRQLGVDVIDARGEQAVLDHEILRKLFDTYYGGIALEYFNAVSKFRSDDIKASDLIAYVGSSSGAAYFPTWIERDNTQVPIEFLSLPYPAFASGESCAIQQGAGMCVSLSTPSRQEGAVVFLKWFTSQDQNIAFAMTTGYLPVQTGSYQSAAFSAALDALSAGEAAQQNVASVYKIALYQITKSITYAASPFAGSYDVRTILQTTLMDMAQRGREEISGLKAQGLTEDALLEALDLDGAFAAWLQTIRLQLDEREIPYTERNAAA